MGHHPGHRSHSRSRYRTSRMTRRPGRAGTASSVPVPCRRPLLPKGLDGAPGMIQTRIHAPGTTALGDEPLEIRIRPVLARLAQTWTHT